MNPSVNPAPESRKKPRTLSVRRAFLLATTIAGLVIHESKSIPEERQAFTFHGKRFLVMKREKNRITRVRIRPAEG